ncbi:PxKF domain-containing protein [Agromyces sp. NPDC058126]|uniref:PxKF domain-containing protein n=1 Tax=Agromyces sp. NPDC058126 TaxID=3346350 RepID=UPI0036DDAD99
MKRWSRSILGAAAAAALVLGGGAIAYADDLETTVTVDDLVVVTPVVDLGVLDCGTSRDVVVKLNLDRGGNGPATIFKSGSTVTFSRTSQTNVSATQPSPPTITLPGDWATLDQNSTVDSAKTTSTITVAAGEVNGTFGGSAGYQASGTVVNGDSKLRTASVSVSWSVENCGVVVDPVDETGPVVTLVCPSDPIPRGEEAYATWSATDEDGGSGVAEGYESGTIPLDTSTLGEHTATAAAGTAVDNEGNASAEASCSFTVVDVTPPEVALICPAGPVLLDSVAEATWTASDEDGGSGLATAASGSIVLDTSSVGAHTATAPVGTAVDNAGNESAEVSCEYSVIYDFAGFFRPVDMNGVVNRVKAGSAVPMKFSLGGDEGLDIVAAGYPKVTFSSCDANAPVDAVESTLTAGGSSLSYDATAGQYVYVWKTDKSWAGKCGTFELGLDDGVVRTAKFKFLK